MTIEPSLSSRELLQALKAAAEPTRLRILRLLEGGELNVKDLTRILGQSQPRLSRHLKLLVEAGLIERFREGSWVYFHLSDRHPAGAMARHLLRTIRPGDATAARDQERAERLKAEREAAAQAYFIEHAGEWDRIRALHVAEIDVEAAILAALGPGPFDLLADLGTGTGRILELFAGTYERGIGIDVNQAMLAYARSNLSRAGLGKAHVRHGDIYSLPIDAEAADAVVMHQVLHFLRDPAGAIREAARILAPGGRLLIVDFAPHELDFLRERHAHVRLGFAADLVRQWLAAAGLEASGEQLLAAPSTDDDDDDRPDKLTVTLWLATKPGGPVRRRHRAPSTSTELKETA